ncbi:MAG: DNA alkylation repair protein [Cyclobacteriaceae bacterium]
MLREIQRELRKRSAAAVKESTLRFVPDAKKVYGVNMPALNELSRKYKEGGFPLIKQLWQSGWFEERMLAAKLLALVANKDPERAMKLVSKMSKEVTDWAICDTIGTQSTRKLIKTMEAEIFGLSARLTKSKSLWQRRLAIVLLINYNKDPSYHERIEKQIAALRNDKEYYVVKAIQWMDRDFAKRLKRLQRGS